MDLSKMEKILKFTMNHFNGLIYIRVVVLAHFIMCLNPVCLIIGLDIIRNFCLHLLAAQGWIFVGQTTPEDLHGIFRWEIIKKL